MHIHSQHSIPRPRVHTTRAPVHHRFAPAQPRRHAPRPARVSPSSHHAHSTTSAASSHSTEGTTTVIRDRHIWASHSPHHSPTQIPQLLSRAEDIRSSTSAHVSTPHPGSCSPPYPIHRSRAGARPASLLVPMSWPSSSLETLALVLILNFFHVVVTQLDGDLLQRPIAVLTLSGSSSTACSQRGTASPRAAARRAPSCSES